MRSYYPAKGIIFLLLGLLSSISSLHLLHIPTSFEITNITIGYLAWFAIICTIAMAGYASRFHILYLFLVFFTFGYFTGSFLEPPADPLDHLRRSYERCDTSIDAAEGLNDGLWQYGMNAAILCPATKASSPSSYLIRADILNGLYYGLGAAVLFLVARSAGFAIRWAVLSVVISFLFFGTNVFSYFRYYSYAPSYTSLLIYWLWITFFFFRKGTNAILWGLICALMTIPVVLVNHLQEAIFLIVLVTLWLSLQLMEVLREKQVRLRSINPSSLKSPAKSLIIKNTIITSFLAIVFFILPQWSGFRTFLSHFFLHDYWQQNQDAVFQIFGWHVGGRIWDFQFRIIDTLGIVGFLPLLLLPLFFTSYEELECSKNRWRILLLGLLPFIIYFVPLFNFIWLSNCVRTPTHLRYYYRMCYAALAWLSIAYVVSLFEYFFLKKQELSNSPFSQRQYMQNCSVFSIFLFIFLLSSIRVFPVYGKFDFLRTDSKPWWPRWAKMMCEMLPEIHGEVYTDPLTGMVIGGAFGKPVLVDNKKIESKILFVEKMDDFCSPARQMFVPAPLCLLLDNVSSEFKEQFIDIVLHNFVSQSPEKSCGSNISAKEKSTTCIVNLQGFSPSWVPFFTGHWNPRITNTKLFYRYHFTRIADLEMELKESPPKHCAVYF